uniref:Elongator complex protein 1 n=1 Tax=Globodera pallida TaxID=36090 RepID=A0A183CMB6_GLOPA
MELKRNVLGSSWSPDLQLLIVATESHLLMISRDFYVISEALIRPTTTGKDQLLTIERRLMTKQCSFPGEAMRNFLRSVASTKFFMPKQMDSPSKNIPLNKTFCRQLRIWNRELDFMSQCEFLAGIEAALCMRSNGNLIAVPRVVSNERHIWFYERNGQSRSKFKLMATNAANCGGGELDARSVVRHLAWNLDSTVLMIYYEDFSTKSFQLQFWTVSNYSWAEKLCLSVEEIIDFFWDPENANKFHYLARSGVYRKILLRSEYNCEDMIVVSINGDRARITDFKYAPIPPPMCHYELNLDFVGTPSAFAQSPVFGLAFVSSDFKRISTFPLQNRRFINGKNIAIEAANVRLLLNLIWRDEKALLAFRKCERSDKSFELVELRLDTRTIFCLKELDVLPFAHTLIPNDRLDWLSNEANCVNVEHVKLDDKCLIALEEMKSREIERCGELIANEPNGTRVWLQMPRGNLEVIHPRPILLERLKRWLDAKEWSKAFVEMRRHRIDLNLLYDHNPKAFNDSIEQFVFQINDVDSLNVFLTSLQSGDTTREPMFAPFYPERQTNQQQKLKRAEGVKVNAICERLRSHLMGIKDEDGDRFTRLYPVVLSSYVAETPSRVSAALANMWTQIAKMKKNEDEHSDLTRRWIKHLTYLVNESVLFKQALKTYDVEIAFLVAHSSNLDPKEYLPVLNDLKKKTPPTYQKYHIDLFMGDWNSALEHIAMLAQLPHDDDVENGVEVGACTASAYLDECLKLVEHHKLYPAAMKLFCGRPHYEEICGITAKEMERNGRLKEAAILHEKAGDLTAAMNCHLKLQNFLEFCRLAKHSKQTEEKIESELRKMGMQMLFKDDHLAAAQLFIYLGKEKILECFEKANAWDKLSAFVSENRPSIQGVVNRAQVILSTRCAQIIEQIDSWRDSLTKHTKRLEVLREEKKGKLATMALTKQLDDGDQLDAFSESSVSSSNTSLSRYSKAFDPKYQSWKKTRKMERKKQTIKDGSRWEDGALLVALKDIHQRIDVQQDELVELLPALLSMDLFERACRLQNEMLTFLEFVANNHEIVWSSNLEAHHLPGPLTELYCDFAETALVEMPKKIQLTNELFPPKLRSTGAEWKLEIIE